jgi:hypothetical protein
MDGATLTCAPQAKAFPSTLGASVSVYCSSCIGFALCGFLLFFLQDFCLIRHQGFGKAVK